jgi:hypothetical protein
MIDLLILAVTGKSREIGTNWKRNISSENLGQFCSRPVRLIPGAETLEGEEKEMALTENVISCLFDTARSLFVQRFPNLHPQTVEIH